MDPVALTMKRLDELAALPPGWFEPDTPALDAGCMAWARAVLREIVEEVGVYPCIGPDPEGGLDVVWDEGESTLSCSFFFPERVITRTLLVGRPTHTTLYSGKLHDAAQFAESIRVTRFFQKRS